MQDQNLYGTNQSAWQRSANRPRESAEDSSTETKRAKVVFDDETASLYDNPGLRKTQQEVAARCLHLLSLKDNESEPKLFLDVGTGTGMSGAALSLTKNFWFGTDISMPMLTRASPLRGYHSTARNLDQSTKTKNWFYRRILHRPSVSRHGAPPSSPRRHRRRGNIGRFGAMDHAQELQRGE